MITTSSSCLFCDSSISIGFHIRLNCQEIDKDNFGTKGEKVSFRAKSELEDIIWID